MNKKKKQKQKQKSQPVTGPLMKRALELYEERRKLPIWTHLADIRKTLRAKDVLLLVGETGSGKSTQVPQTLLRESWCQKRTAMIHPPGESERMAAVGGLVAVTEPRRVAAISLARRVAAEMATPLGSSSPASQVGYSVRFDRSISPSTRIVFLTEGMLLQELLRDPWLRQYSAVIVDEVHERGVNVDLVLGFLRRMITGDRAGRGGVPLKVVVMSATANFAGLYSYFTQVDGDSKLQKSSIQDTKAPDRSLKHSESGSPWSGLSDSEGGLQNNNGLGAVQGQNRVEVCKVKGRQHPVEVIYLSQPASDILECALHKIFEIHYSEAMPGDILVFMTGQEDIEALETLIDSYATQMPPELPKILPLPLFAALPPSHQERVFLPAPKPNTRKVILSTNIAETSVTVPGVRYVVDCGKAKVRQFRSRLGLDSLLAKPISKSSAMQRMGRAGREAAGKCYRLYSEKDYHALEDSTPPEILRCDLSQTILMIKARGVEEITSFPFLSPPPREALEKALLQLHSLGALDETGSISDLGRKMAPMPLTPALSRALLAAATPEMDCLLEVIDIISSLTVENVFLPLISEDHKEEAETARKQLYRREGDHLTLLTTVQQYALENTDRKDWARRHFVSHRAMRAVMDVRKQLHAICHARGLLPAEVEIPSVASPERATTILKCFLTGFAMNTARISADGSYTTVAGHHPIAIHPSSTLYGRRVEAIMYYEHVFTTKGYAKCVSAVQMDWVAEAYGLS
ncbi:MAG: hypothetical protein M1823_005338 [Watsoniomyces obsoletus]|nr:MAG: hypothetical protein M1823_005338 [Watsoniomyces obsoletus]